MKLLALLASVFLLSGQDQKMQKISDFTVESLNGEKVQFSQIAKDKIVVIDFWSCKCPWSKAWDKELVKIYQDYKDKDIVFCIIDANATESKEEVAAYIKENEIPFAVYRDPKSKVADVFDAKTTPHVYVLDKERNIFYQGAIDDDAKGEKAAEERTPYLRNALEAVLAGKELKNNSTKPVGCTIKRPQS